MKETAMSSTEDTEDSEDRADVGEDEAVVVAVQGGDEETFASLAEPHRKELRVHCYRMLGNFDDAEDLVQETMTRAWRGRTSFEGRSTFRAWLYRIATNACLDAVKAKRRRVQIVDVAPSAGRPPGFDEVPWLQPIPDAFVPGVTEPDEAVVAKETIELAFLAAVQHLPPRPRAVLILRDVLGWTASETADALDGTVPSVNSALQRARTRMQELGRPGRMEWSPVQAPTADERILVQQYMDAHARADASAVIELLGEEVRFSMPPQEMRFEGRAAVSAFFRDLLGVENPGDWRLVPTHANGQLAVANYIRAWGETDYRASVLDVLKIDDGVLVEITTFGSEVFPRFGMPPVLPVSEPSADA
jgi:RNA polymerase sigma-70 factor (ECF subfamily)